MKNEKLNEISLSIPRYRSWSWRESLEASWAVFFWRKNGADERPDGVRPCNRYRSPCDHDRAKETGHMELGHRQSWLFQARKRLLFFMAFCACLLHLARARASFACTCCPLVNWKILCSLNTVSSNFSCRASFFFFSSFSFFLAHITGVFLSTGR